MRDERWTDRFFYAWDNTLSYDPLEVYYNPRPGHFIDNLDEPVRSRFVRSGYWWIYQNNPHLPTQGWKIHVSAHHRNVHKIAATMLDYLIPRDIHFKLSLDLNIFEMLNSKGMGRGSGGKFMTIYPNGDDEFRARIAEIAQLLEGEEGPYVLSDMRYRDCKALYFRYGQFIDTYSVDAMGRWTPHIMGPDGRVSDQRQPAFSLPPWVSWPFPDWHPDDDKAEDGDADQDLLVGGRFRVTEAIQFSYTGGVYQAEDTENDNRPVILKEARPHTNCNPRRDHDAVDILAREWTFLNRLADAGRFPQPVATFRHWEHHFIAEEVVDGRDIRAVMIDNNPLVRARIDAEQSRQYLRIFIAVFRGLAQTVQAAHDRQVVLGDLTATNLMVNPETFDVSIIDLEACRLSESADGDTLQESVELYTPGFSHSRRFTDGSAVEGDLYSVAAIMAYFIFPVAAMSYLRDDLFDLYRIYIDDLGWPTAVHDLITGLAQARISLTDALGALRDEEALVAQVELPPPAPIAGLPDLIGEVEPRVAAFVEAMVDPDRVSLFPVDPFAHLTNPLSLGFGASGVLWALNASGRPVRPEWRDWLGERVAKLELVDYPDGLMNGLAGIARAIDDLGFRTQARELLAHANRRAGGVGDYTFYYGLAGLGMANLHFYLRDDDERHLAAARECAQALRDTAQHDGDGVYWLNEFVKDKPLTGLGFGQAGVALFLLRMYQVTADESYLRLGRRALDWEMANAEPWGDDSVIFKHDRTNMPYAEVGSAGVAQVLLRYGDLDAARTVLRGLAIGHTSLPSYAFGMAGIADTMLDAAEIIGDPSYRDTALRQLEYIRKVFLFESPERFKVPSSDGVVPLAMPGEGLLRCSCDLLTGSTGVLRVLHRFNHGGTTDFLLDELQP